MKIGVIGKGFVGSTIYEGLGQINNKMSFYDPKFPSKMEDVLDTEVVFVCVPTDQKDDGSCDISIVEDVVLKLKQCAYNGMIAIKSTVVPGTTQKLINRWEDDRICFVPEFLRERSALTDFMLHHDVLVVGAQNHSRTIIDAHGNIPKNVMVMSPTEAELAKYFNNVFNAARITFANGFFDVCQEMDCDYQKILEAMTLRENIDHHYLRASENLRGFGGYCLPKDTEAFQSLVKSLGLKSGIFKAIVDDNNLYRRTVFEGMRA